ncbi:transposase [Streptomyces chartreusis]|uniref:transposase n=1 Tax=Streptomyces chartreusis TaxID=1969 RepID=UPI0021012EFF|nr:transposase [Streptomyces chartreusis]
MNSGRQYGIFLVDIETGRSVDVVRDCSTATFAAWLTDHPGVEIVWRDRATAYTNAIKEAGPPALEIADRWHLL